MNTSNSLCEEQNFTAVFEEYASTLHHYLFYQTGNDTLSQDLTQEAFTRLWKNCATVALQTAKGYVFTIAKNLLRNNYDHQKVVLNYQKRPQREHTHEDPLYILEEQELAQQLEVAIANLPEKQRVVFLLSRIDKKTYKEIAEMLGISKQAVEKRIYKALDTLRTVCQNIR